MVDEARVGLGVRDDELFIFADGGVGKSAQAIHSERLDARPRLEKETCLINENERDRLHAEHPGGQARDPVKPFFRRSIQQVERAQGSEPVRLLG